MRTGPKELRLLPWLGEGGKPCYLWGSGGGRVSRMADDIERAQVSMAVDLLDHAADLLSDRRATGAQVHYVACRLAESLQDVLRVAHSRGARLRPSGDPGLEGGSDGDDESTPRNEPG